MIKAGLWVPRKQRAPKIQQPRYRRACCGELIQIDVQDKRHNNRSQALPAGDDPSRRRRKPTEKKFQRSLNGDDMLEALKTLQSRTEEIFGKRK